jgi:hypothetical protein
MPLIKARTHRITMVRHICRLKAPNRDVLVLYARFIGDTQDYVLNQLIETTIAKDREFVAWCAEHPATAEPAPESRTPPGASATSTPVHEETDVTAGGGPRGGSVALGARDERNPRP